MLDTRLHTHGHLQHSSESNYNDFSSNLNTTGLRAMPSAEMNSTMRPGHNTDHGVPASSQDHFYMVPTQNLTMDIDPIVVSYERNEHQSLHMTQNSSAGNNTYNTLLVSQLEPPPLARVVAISLPLLSPNIPIQTHALITYRPSSTPIFWNISLHPSTAQLALAISGQGAHPLGWTRDVAVTPRALSSITIRIRGVARPVVVFPIETGRPIRIVDILRAVYSAMRTAALEYGVATRNVPVYVPSSESRDLAFEDIAAPDAIRRHFNNRIWWNGLSQSTNEVDVWILHLRGPSRGGFRRPNIQPASGRR